MAEHVDGNRIHTDLRYRFSYLSKFLNFTSDDIAMLNTFAPIVFPVIPVITDTVYRKLFSFDITKQYFVLRNEICLAHKIQEVTLESSQIELRKDMLSMYLKRVLTQSDWNDSFLQYLSQIGKIHTDQAGSSSINVDYMHINLLLGYVDHLLIDLLCNTDTIDEQTKRGILMALNKFFWIQNDFFSMHYLISVKDNIVSKQISSISSKSLCCWKNPKE